MFDFQRLRQLLCEKFEKIKTERGERILRKFDELQEHYHNKEERLMMKINDLESRLNFIVPNERKRLEEKLEKGMKLQYDKLLKKYFELRKSMEQTLNETSNKVFFFLLKEREGPRFLW